MTYNDKYFFEFATLKTANKSQLYYKVLFAQKEDIPVVYDLVELKASNSPFILSYKSAEDFAFSPFRVSSAEINILYPYGASDDVPQPENFFTALDDLSWRVQLLESTDNGVSFQLKWQGFLINDVQYEWQDAYYYRLTATDNLGSLKAYKYSDDIEFKCPDYLPLEGVSVKDYIIELVNKTGNILDFKFAWNLFNEGSEKTLNELFTSKYNAIDWKTYQPKEIYEVLNDLLLSLGAIIYLDNNDSSWTVLNIPEIGTRNNNQVPYIKYNYEGTLISAGNLNLASSINTGATDLIWRDTNQTINFIKPIGSYEIEIDYIGKNLLGNYSFQENDSTTPNWLTFGTFSNIVQTNGQKDFGLSYDTNYLKITASESNLASLDTSNYLYQNIDLENTQVVTSTLNRANNFFMVFLEFKSYAPFSNVSSTNEGYNFQLRKADPARGTVFYDTTNFSFNRENGGNWMYGSGADASRIAVFSDSQNPYQKVTLLTRGVGLNNDPATMQLVFLKYRYDFSFSVSGEYKIDEARLCIIPSKYYTINKFKYIAKQNPKYNKIKKQSIFTGGFNTYDWYAVEGALGLKDENNKLYCNAFWDRHWEQHDEQSYNYLDAIVGKSIISFYRNVSRKFTGNVYGEEISFPKYFEIDAAVNKNSVKTIEDAFEFYVLNDGGTIENTYCSENFLAEFYEINSKFLMIEATFDYANSTTNVNLHEDLTVTTEPNFTAGFGGFVQSGGVFPQQIGSTTTNFEQEPTDTGG